MQLLRNGLVSTGRMKMMCRFSSRKPDKVSSNPNYITTTNHTKQPTIKEDPSPIEQQVNPHPKLTPLGQTHFHQLTMFNVVLAGIAPFYPPASISVSVVSSAFLLNHIGRPFREYLLLANNEKYEALPAGQSPKGFIRKYTTHIFMLTVQTALLAYASSSAGLFATVVWYIVAVYKNNLNPLCFPVILSLVLALSLTWFGEDIRRLTLNEE